MSRLNLFLAQQRNAALASKWRVLMTMAALVIVVAAVWTVGKGGQNVGAQIAPAVTGVRVSSTPVHGSTYLLGETITVTVSFSENVTVTGTPTIDIDMDPAEWGTKQVSYAGGSGSANLVFNYEVVEPNYSTQGIAVLENTLALNGGAIGSASGVDANLAHDGLAHDSSHKVNWEGSPPTYSAADCNPVVQVSASRSHEARVTWSAPDDGCDVAAISVQLRRKTSATTWGAWGASPLYAWADRHESIFHKLGIGPNGFECGAKGNFCWDFQFRLAHTDSSYGNDVPENAYTYTAAVPFTVPHGTRIINVGDDYRVITHYDGSLQVKWEQYDGLLDYRVRHKPADDDDAVWTTSPLLTMTCNDAVVSATTPCVDNHHVLTYDIPGLAWSHEYLVEVGAEKTLADGRKAMFWSVPERFTVAASGAWFVNDTPNSNPGLGRVFLMSNAEGAEVSVACFINAGQINCPPLTLVSLDIYRGGNYNLEARSNSHGVRGTSPRGLQGFAMVGTIPGPDPLTLSSEAPGTITATWNEHRGSSLPSSQSLSPTGISLSLDKASTSEAAGFDIYTVTGMLQGGTMDSDVVVTVSVGSRADSAIEGTDYITVDEFTLTIPSGSASGTARFSLQPATGDGWENDEHISVTGSSPGLPVAGTMTTIVDNSRGLQVSATALTVAEGGTATYTLELRSPPTTASSMKLSVEGSPFIKVSPTSLDFTLDDWNTARTITVTSTQNSHSLFDQAEIIHAIAGGGYDLIETPRVTVGVTNDDNNRRVLEAYILSYREKPLLPIKRDGSDYWGQSSTGEADSDFTWTAYDGISEIKLGTDVLTYTITGLSPGIYEVNVQPCTALEGVGIRCLVPQSDGTVKDIPGSRRGLPTGVHVIEVK